MQTVGRDCCCSNAATDGGRLPYGSIKVGFAKVGSAKVGYFKVGSAKVGFVKEGFAYIRLNLG
jgi:hypothetical protein